MAFFRRKNLRFFRPFSDFVMFEFYILQNRGQKDLKIGVVAFPTENCLLSGAHVDTFPVWSKLKDSLSHSVS